MLIEKFASVQTKINLYIDQLSKSIQHLSQKKPERCLYGWECKRRFCKYSHEYLYSYSKFASSKCDETFNTSDHLEKHQKNLHRVTQEIAVNLQPKFSKSNNQRTKVNWNEKKEETRSSSSSSPVTTSTPSSITSSSRNSSFSVNNSEREEVGGMSLSNSL